MALSSPIRFSTKIPSPLESSNPVALKTESQGELVIDTCSEYMKYHAFVDYFKKSGKLRLVHGAAGEPVVFVINDSDELCVLQLGAKSCEGWSCTNITPTGFTVATYDIVVAGMQALIAVACKKDDDTASGHQLFFSPLNLTSLEVGLASLMKKDDTVPAWKHAVPNTTNPIGDLDMNSVLCKINGPIAGPQTKFQIVIGSAAANDRIATLYTVTPEAQSGEYWSILSYPAAAASITQVEPLVLGQAGMAEREVGLISRFTDFAADKSDRIAGHVYAKEGGVIRSFEFKTSKLGKIRSVFSHCNPWGLTDVFVTGEKGIGFYDSKAIDVLATPPILEDKSFQQVLASEAADPAKPMEQSKLAVFALSDDHSLYYIEGTRDFKTRKITFQHSGIPIREDIYQMSSMYSATYGTSELLFTQSNVDKIKYMRRNPAGNVWIEDEITSKGKKSIKYDAFVTTITLTDSVSKSPAIDFPVKISSENLHVVANGATYALSQKATTLQTDASGSITIVIPANNELGCPSLKLTVDEQGKKGPEASSFSCEIEPSGRIDRYLGKIRTADDLRNAKSSSNTLPFQHMDPKALENAASILNSYGEAKTALENEAGRSKTGVTNEPKIIMGDIGSEPPSVLTAVEDTVVGFLGDAIEFLKKIVKATTRVVLYVVGPVVKFAFKILGKWVSFTIKCLYNLLSAVGSCLKDVFGWDGLNRLLEYCRLAVDPESIKSTQGVFKKVLLGSIQLTGRMFDVNRSSISDLFDDGAAFLKEFIDDPREAPTNTSKPAILQLISAILNNPFIKLIMKINPVSWIIEAINEQIPGIQLPSLGDVLGTLTEELSETAGKQLDVLDQAMATFYKQLQSVLNDPTQFWEAMQKALKTIFWSLFDTLKNFVESVYSIVTAVIKAIGSVLEGVWKIPGVTDSWEDLTGQDFSLLGFMTFGPAVLANFIGLSINGKLPFQGKEELFDFNTIEVKPFYTSNRKQEKPESGSMNFKAETHNTSAEAKTYIQPAMVMTNRAPMKPFNVQNGASISGISMSEKSASQSQSSLPIKKATWGFPDLTHLPADVLNTIKHIFAMIKHFAFAGGNGYSLVITVQNRSVQNDDVESWLSFLKLAAGFIASVMTLMQAVTDATAHPGVAHLGVALGFGGVACASYALNMTRKKALDFGSGGYADYLRSAQIETAKVCRELAQWLGWIASAIHILNTGPLNDAVTWWHVTAPVFSAATWAATYIYSSNPDTRFKAALIIALILAMGNNTGLGGYHLYKAITGE